MQRTTRVKSRRKVFGVWAFLSLVVAGCVYVPPDWEGSQAVHQTEAVVKGTTTKQDIVRQFGPPQSVNAELNIFTYRETSHGGVFCLAVPGRRIYRSNVYTMKGGCRSLGGDTRGVRIFFDDRDRVLDMVSWGVSDDADFEELAEAGDPDAQYKLAVDQMHEGETQSGLLWLCRALHGGSYKARSNVADRFRDGWAGDAPDLVQAYGWYSLAAAQGSQYSRLRLKALLQELDEGQIKEAELRAADWSPNPIACEQQDTVSAVRL